ncbi:MAG: pentapeptide repeat-containing protein [Leptolyngbya sp. SIO1D8]|nr:pentapeptide repeat-containing protein [Leptolyngbya sp. SIO1D8]
MGADLSYAYLKNSKCLGTWFRQSNLFRTDFREAILLGADFEKARLCEANLTRANLRQAKLIGTNLTEADLTAVDLDEIEWNSRTQWSNAIGLHTARNIPEELHKHPEFSAAFILSQGIELVRTGSVEEALTAYKEAQRIMPHLKISAHSWNQLCWFGTLHGYASNVLFAGNSAVAIAPENWDFRDSQAVARGASGDLEGAHDDLKFILEKNSWNASENVKRIRRKWISLIETGVNPFTADELHIVRETEA